MDFANAKRYMKARCNYRDILVTDLSGQGHEDFIWFAVVLYDELKKYILGGVINEERIIIL